MRPAFLGAMTMMMFGCSAGSDPAPEPQTPGDGFLSAARIRELFEDGPVLLETPALHPVEVFRPDGTYFSSGRVSLWGRYRVSEGALCVQLDGREERCRSVFRDNEGRLFLGDTVGSKHPAAPVDVQPLEE